MTAPDLSVTCQGLRAAACFIVFAAEAAERAVVRLGGKPRVEAEESPRGLASHG